MGFNPISFSYKSALFLEVLALNEPFTLSSVLKRHPLEIWNTLFSFILWHIWLRRNSWIFNRSNIPLHKAVHQCIWAASECYFSESQKPSTTAWLPPSPPFFKINYDASFNHVSKEVGVGGVCRDHLGTWIRDNNWQYAILSTDSKRAVEEIKSPTIVENIPKIILKCRDLLRELPHLELLFEDRGGNAVADSIVKDARCNMETMHQISLLYLPAPCGNVAFESDRCSNLINYNSSSAGDVPANAFGDVTNVGINS